MPLLRIGNSFTVQEPLLFFFERNIFIVFHLDVGEYHLLEVIVELAQPAIRGQRAIGLPGGMTVSLTLPFDLWEISTLDYKSVEKANYTLYSKSSFVGSVTSVSMTALVECRGGRCLLLTNAFPQSMLKNNVDGR